MCDDQYNIYRNNYQARARKEAPFPESAENVRRMLERLDADGFTDFYG